MFYSVQGEGISTGVPSIFIRLNGCNLMCGGSQGELLKAGKATWWCDSEKIWRNGQFLTNESIEQKIIEMGQLENVLKGNTSLIWTGGEPTLSRNVKDIMSFLDWFNEKHPKNNIFNEIETNGTTVVPGAFYSDLKYINQINCSPKLENSGMLEAIRINPTAIAQIKNHYNFWFKIVVSTEDDVKEAFRDYINRFEIPISRVILMPGVDCLKDLSERTRWVFVMSKKYNVRSCTRAHILAWDKTCGV